VNGIHDTGAIDGVGLAQIEEYLSRYYNKPVELLHVAALSDRTLRAAGDSAKDRPSLKSFGYGGPVVVEFRRGDQVSRVVLRTVTANVFGHDYRADRAAELLLGFDTFNSLPQHLAALDVGIFCFDRAGAQGATPAPARMLSLGAGDEFFLLTPYAEGTPYAMDLARLRDGGKLQEGDLARARRLARYLAEIHAQKYPQAATQSEFSNQERASLYRRRIRDTLGSGEGIMGLTDSYPPEYAPATPAWLEAVEKARVAWRWWMKGKSERLCQVHGDFHPFNILFSQGTDFTLLDRSRGAWGEAADDVACLAINYLFFSLQRSGALASPFVELWENFWQGYLEASRDGELLAMALPFMVWRALVLASPTWYNVDDAVRMSLFRLIDALLREDAFDPARINQYCSG
jgi:hypothetical protein